MAKTTKTISARLPIGAYNEFMALVKEDNSTISKYIQKEVVGKKINLEKYSKGGEVNIIDKETEDLLAPILGGAGIGLGIYFVVKKFMEVNYPERDAKQDATLSAMVIGVGSMFAIGKLKK